MKSSELNEVLAASILFVLTVLLLALIAGSWRAIDCGSFDISAYKLGNVPARCAGYLVN